MSDSKTVGLPPRPEGAIPESKLVFTKDELAQITQTDAGAVQRKSTLAEKRTTALATLRKAEAELKKTELEIEKNRVQLDSKRHQDMMQILINLAQKK